MPEHFQPEFSIESLEATQAMRATDSIFQNLQVDLSAIKPSCFFERYESGCYFKRTHREMAFLSAPLGSKVSLDCPEALLDQTTLGSSFVPNKRQNIEGVSPSVTGWRMLSGTHDEAESAFENDFSTTPF